MKRLVPDFSQWTWGDGVDELIKPLCARIASVLFEQIKDDWKLIDLGENGLEIAFCYDESEDWITFPFSEMSLGLDNYDMDEETLAKLNAAIPVLETWLAELAARKEMIQSELKREQK